MSRFKKQLTVLLSFVLVVSALSGCTPAKDPSPTEITSEATTEAVSTGYKAGAYVVESEGRDGTIKLEVTFSETEITDIKVLSQTETTGLGDQALETMKQQILNNQSLAVDAVAGASESSEAMLAAVEAAVVLAGGDVAKLKAAAVVKPSEGKTETYEADLVVIGAGASGVSAAVSAADLGAKVILIEKTANVGGASNLSWAGKFYNSTPAVENGVIIEVEKEIADWIYNNHWRVDAAAIRQYVTRSGETYEWLASKGYQTTFINFFGEPLHMLPAYETRQGLLRTMIEESVVANGGSLMTETTGKSLITDADGNVIGVIAEKSDGTKVEITSKAVVMATGGYAADAEMVKELFGFEGINGGLGQNIGEGLKMAWEIGAKVPDNIGGQMLHQTLASATSNLKKTYESFEASYPLMLTYLPNFMNVSPSGARFRDEAATLEAVAAANTSAFNGPFHYVIVSETQLNALQAKGMSGINAPSLPGMPPEFYLDFAEKFTLEEPWTDVVGVFETMVANGDGYKGDTLEALAVNAGMSETVFAEAFIQYTQAIETGSDTAFGKNPAYLTDMGESGPYYAIKAEINNLGSVGGLLVNYKFEVLNDSRIPIKGLYAVGLESEGVLYNDTYVGNGVGIGYSFTSGKLGGTYAAEFINNLK